MLGIGAADMPVVISFLNSYSGWTCACSGFLLHVFSFRIEFLPGVI